MKIAVLFDGAGLARLGLEQAGHQCTGFEIDPWKQYLGSMVGSGNVILTNVLKVDLTRFGGVWASPPCQLHSLAYTSGSIKSQYAEDYIEWCLGIAKYPLWVENVLQGGKPFRTATVWNAGQFTETPIQSRNRAIGGAYPTPKVFRSYKNRYDACPTVTASEYKGCASDKRRASRYYQRRLTLDEVAYHQGFEIPDDWQITPDGFTDVTWGHVLYEALGNGVPVYMARAFGEATNG